MPRTDSPRWLTSKYSVTIRQYSLYEKRVSATHLRDGRREPAQLLVTVPTQFTRILRVEHHLARDVDVLVLLEFHRTYRFVVSTFQSSSLRLIASLDDRSADGSRNIFRAVGISCVRSFIC